MSEPSRFIIYNHSDLPDAEALVRASRVVTGGRISEGPKGPQYCWATTWKDGVKAYCRRNKASDRIDIYRETEGDDHAPR